MGRGRERESHKRALIKEKSWIKAVPKIRERRSAFCHAGHHFTTRRPRAKSNGAGSKRRRGQTRGSSPFVPKGREKETEWRQRDKVNLVFIVDVRNLKSCPRGGKKPNVRRRTCRRWKPREKKETQRSFSRIQKPQENPQIRERNRLTSSQCVNVKREKKTRNGFPLL